jgi:hypothetical protein
MGMSVYLFLLKIPQHGYYCIHVSVEDPPNMHITVTASTNVAAVVQTATQFLRCNLVLSFPLEWGFQAFHSF